jgi:hypothetical protein
MDVAWTFTETQDAVHVAIGHDFRPPWPLVGDFVADRIIGPHFVEAIAGQTLSVIKQTVERETLTTSKPS